MQGDGLAGSLSRRQQAIELAVFLLLILPSLALSFTQTGQGGPAFPLLAIATIMRDLGLLALIFLLLARASEPVAAVGWVRRRLWWEAGLGLLLSVPVLIGTQALEAALRAAGLSGPSPAAAAVRPQATTGEILLAVVLVVVVAIAEETIFRGYLVLRFANVLRSRAWAVIFSSVAFALGHGYEGSAAVLTVGVMGLVFAIIYVWRRSLVAVVVIHLVLDLLAVVIAPLVLG